MDYKEKAKAYDRALERAKIWKDKSGMPKDKQGILDDIFPELTESEDERIRKALIDALNKNLGNGIEKYGTTLNAALAWLEKQKSVKEIVERYKNSWYNEGKIAGMAEGLTDDEKYQQGWHDALEKQGEQKPTDVEEPDFFDDFRKTDSEVEPKFHEGDWIVFNGLVLFIKEVVQGYYRTISRGGIPNSYDWDIDNIARLWTIRDAKDGDVLSAEDKDKIFIYNGKLDLRGRVCAYCGIYKTHDGLLFTKCAIGNYFTYKEPYPATKEQRDTLEKAMANTGYTFDFEKKELKKIEQEDEEYNGEDYGIDSLYHAQRILEKTLGKVEGYQSDDGILEHKCAITAVKKLYKKKPAEWSEEDERNMQNVDSVVFYDNRLPEDTCVRLRNWLKSLKQRYTWKPSEKQMNALDSTLQYNQVSRSSVEHLNSLYNDLKKLTE